MRIRSGGALFVQWELELCFAAFHSMVGRVIFRSECVGIAMSRQRAIDGCLAVA
jgi:hypothetical protein